MSGSGTEEPDWAGSLRDLERVDTDRARGGVERDEGGRKAWLIRGGVELLSAWIGKRRLGYGVVATTELELDEVTNGRSDLVRAESESRRTIFTSTDDNSDVGGESGGDKRSDTGEGSGELHF